MQSATNQRSVARFAGCVLFDLLIIVFVTAIAARLIDSVIQSEQGAKATLTNSVHRASADRKSIAPDSTTTAMPLDCHGRLQIVKMMGRERRMPKVKWDMGRVQSQTTGETAT